MSGLSNYSYSEEKEKLALYLLVDEDRVRHWVTAHNRCLRNHCNHDTAHGVTLKELLSGDGPYQSYMKS